MSFSTLRLTTLPLLPSVIAALPVLLATFAMSAHAQMPETMPASTPIPVPTAAPVTVVPPDDQRPYYLPLPLQSQKARHAKTGYSLTATRFAFNAGAFFPLGALFEQVNRHTGLNLNLSYDLQPLRLSRSLSFATYLEVAGVGRPTQILSPSDTIEDATILSGLGVQTRAAAHIGKGQVYALAGGGLYRIDRSRSVFRADNSDNDTSDSGYDANELGSLLGFIPAGYLTGTLESHFLYRSGFHLGGGVLLGNGGYGEVRLLNVGTWQGIPYRGLTVNLGARF